MIERRCGEITAAVAHIRLPVLIVAGELDRIDPPDTLKTEVLARISGATMQKLPGTGHLSPLEASAEIAATISQFVISL